MGFLSPWFLAGLAAVGLPVYFHLLRQHRSTPRPFSSLMFFERSTQSSIKHRKLRYLLLLAARLALLVLLALAFASPFINRTVLPYAGGRKLLVLVVDNSFSMREGNRLERAKQEAVSAVSNLREGDEGQVATLGSQIGFLTQPTPEANELVAAIQSIKAGDARSSYGELARVLRSLSETSRAPIEVHLFSDMQASSMPPGFADLQLPADARLVLHPTSEERAPNFAVENVIAPSSLFDPEKARVQATISGFGTESGRRNVSLVAAGKTLESKVVEIPANGRATVEFLSLEVPYGFTRCEVRIDSADSLGEDDRFLFAVERADARQILFVHRARESRALLYFQSALDSSANAAFRLQAIEVERAGGIDPTRYAVVVLSDVGAIPEAFEMKLKQYVRGGGGVLVTAGPVSARRLRVPVFDQAVVESRYASRSDKRFLTAGEADQTHPSIRKAGGWDGVKFYHAVHVEPGEARVIARLSDETPLLLEKGIGEGRVLLFASTFDNVSNDFPLHPAFVPFVEQTAHYLGGLEERTANLTVDSFLELRAGRGQAQSVEVIDPDGNRPLSLEEAGSTQAFRVAREGFYELRRANDRNEMIAVNADRREADLALAPQETLQLWQNTGERTTETAAVVESVQKPWNLWWYVLLVALAAAIAESLLAGRYLSIDRGAE